MRFCRASFGGLELVDVKESWTGNICFGGKDLQTFFITGRKSL